MKCPLLSPSPTALILKIKECFQDHADIKMGLTWSSTSSYTHNIVNVLHLHVAKDNILLLYEKI